LYPFISLKLAFPIQQFDVIQLLGRLDITKLSSTSQYVPKDNMPLDNFVKMSQTGSGYQIAELGDIHELYERFRKYDHEDKVLDLGIADFVISSFTDKINECNLLTFEDAYSELNKDSSVGYGAKSLGIKSRKFDEDLRGYLKSYYDQSQKSPLHAIITISQKDEVRVVGKTPRLFTSFPVEHTFLCSLVFGDFLRQFYDHRFCIDGSVSAVGDPMQAGSLAIYKHELSKRKYLYCTDTNAQDSSVTRKFLELVYDKLLTKYNLTDEEYNLFQTCKINSIDKVTTVCGMLYLLPRGLGSGDYLTVVINIMWRLYMVVENYSHPKLDFFKHNTPIINGDDLIMSSDYGDIDLNSQHAGIEWAGKPVQWEDMDFCSHKFHPYIHQDPKKVRAVLAFRKKRSYGNNPLAEMQRLGGLLRVLSDEETYKLILSQMFDLCDKHNLEDVFAQQYITYEELYELYNSPITLY